MNIFKDVVTFWKETWHESKLIFFLELIGTFASMGAAVELSTNVVPNLLLVFTLYIIGSMSLMYVTYYRRSSWMLVMFTFFTLMNLVGFSNHI